MNIDSFRPVFIIGPGNCGFELFVSLLDNHEEVVVMPYTLKFYAFYNLLELDKIKNLETLKNIILSETKLERFKKGYNKIENPFGIIYKFFKIYLNLILKYLKKFLEFLKLIQLVERIY